MNVRRTSLRSATRSSARNNKGNENNDDSKHENSAQHEDADDEDDNDNDNDAAMSTSDTTNVFVLDGVKFDNYNDFVLAKRKRNQQVLMALGFGGNGPSMSSAANKRFKLSQEPSQRGLRSNKKNKSTKNPVVGRSRKSSRIAGDKTKLVALDYNVNEWHRDNSSTVIISGEGCDDTEDAAADGSNGQQQLVFFNDRVNNGDSLCVKEAIELNDPKWIHNDSEMVANDLFQYVQRDTTEPFKEISTSRSCRDKTKSPTSIMACLEETTEVSKVIEKVEGLSIDNEEWVAKVTPDRIYSVAAHPSESKLICCAGDKRGYVGLWDVDGGSSNNSNNKSINNNAATSPGDEHNTTISTQSNKSSNALFRVHSRPICCLEWLNNENMVTASYDGSVRQLNVETGIFEEIFATYDDSDTTYAEDLGFGLDQGYRYWTQSVAVDHRSKGSSNPCLFVSTSIGDVFHVDLRVAEKQKITFHESLSTKKINTVRYALVFFFSIFLFLPSCNSLAGRKIYNPNRIFVGLTFSSLFFSINFGLHIFFPNFKYSYYLFLMTIFHHQAFIRTELHSLRPVTMERLDFSTFASSMIVEVYPRRPKNRHLNRCCAVKLLVCQ